MLINTTTPSTTPPYILPDTAMTILLCDQKYNWVSVAYQLAVCWLSHGNEGVHTWRLSQTVVERYRDGFQQQVSLRKLNMRAELENPSLQTDLQNKGMWYVNMGSEMLFFFFEGFSDSESKAEREWEEHQKVINRCKKCKSSVSKGRLRRKEYFGMSAT